MVMVLDIDGVGRDMKSIPIIAFSDIPKVNLKETFLDFGELFLRDPKDKVIVLQNTSGLSARYKVLPQASETQNNGKIHTDHEEGIIGPYNEAHIKVTLTTLIISEVVNFDLNIRIIAFDEKPLTVKIKANSSGPRVIIKETFVDFNEVDVLTDHYRKLHVENCSSIKADFTAFMRNKDSVFKPIQKHHHLEPKSSMEIEIVCHADDTRTFDDMLHFVIKEGMTKDIRVRAKGIGKTIFCKERLDKIDFGTQYTFKQQTKEIFIENKGRRDQLLEWVRKKPDKKKEDDEKGNKAASTRTGGKKDEEVEPTPTFSIFPESKLLPKKNGLMFTFRAVSTKRGKISETFILQSTIEGDRKPTKLYETEICGEFINPKLTFDLSESDFVYDWVKGVPPKVISRNIGITCDSVLPTKFKLVIEKPFSVFPDHFDLSAFKKVTARLDFEPNYNTSKRSCVEKRQLKVKHSKHPFVEELDVVGVFNFPNLELETHEIKFGSVLNDTSKKVHMKMTNVSKMNVEYQWNFLDDEQRDPAIDTVPINEIFDILPLNGILEPGQVETVEFVYYGLPNKNFEAKAICQIEGGPEERVFLSGESSKIDYSLAFPGSTAKNEIEFKEIPFSQWTVKEFVVQNLGKVPFDFKVKTDGITRKGLLHIKPSTGKIPGGGKCKIKVHFCPGIPGDYLEKFKIQVAHFEAETIYLRGFGQYPALKFELNRLVDDDLRKRLEDEGQQLDNISIDSQTSSITKMFPDGEMISRLDRKILADAVLKNIEERAAAGAASPDNSYIPEAAGDKTNNETVGDETVPDANASVPNATGSGTATGALATTARGSGFAKSSPGANKFEKQLYENIVVGTYTLDLGNVIAGSQASYHIRVYNVGKLPQITVTFDQRYIRPQGFRLSQDRAILKNKDKNYEDIKVIFSTKKNSPTGRQTYLLPVDIENGPKYNIEITTNVTVPELGFSDQVIEFGKVICGQKKIITLRISNDKDVDCKWNIVAKKEVKKKPTDNPNDIRFTINPSSGTLPSKGKMNVELTFVPGQDRVYQNTFEVSMEDNQRKLELTCNGQGISPNLQFLPDELVFDHCLPYESMAYKCVEIKNHSEFDVEFFSLDFDTQLPEEEKMLAAYDPLQKVESMNMAVRKPGDLIWQEIRSFYSVVQENIKLNAKINKIRDDKTIPEEERNSQIAELEKTRKVVQEDTKYPMAIPESEKRFVVMWGPKGCGKTALATQLAKEHQRGLLNFAEVLKWNVEAGTAAGKAATEFLAKRAEEKEAFLIEKEKQRKKNPKRKPGEEENLYLERFGWLTADLLTNLLKERLKSVEFNAGGVIDNLGVGDFYENELVGMKAILEACKENTVQVLSLKHMFNEAGQPMCADINIRDLEQGEKELEMAKSGIIEEKKKKLVDRKTLQVNKKDKTVREKKEAAPTKELGKKGTEKDKSLKVEVHETEENDTTALDIQAKSFEVVELHELKEEQHAKHKTRTTELYDYIQGKISDDQINKLEIMLKKMEEEEEAKNAKTKPKPGDKDKDKKASNKPSRPETASHRTAEPSATPLKGREWTEMYISYSPKMQFLNGTNLVPKVNFPDPVTLPLPEDQIFQILRRKDPRKIKPKPDYFEILTPPVWIKEDVVDKLIEEEFKAEKAEVEAKKLEIDGKIQAQALLEQQQKQEKYDKAHKEYEERLAAAQAANSAGATPGAVSPPGEGKSSLALELSEPKFDDKESSVLVGLKSDKQKLIEEFEAKVSKKKRELMAQNKIPFEPSTLKQLYRWIVPKGKSIILIVRFFSKKPGDFSYVLDFDNIYSTNRVVHYKVKTVCDFPRICTLPTKVFAVRKQSKPTNVAELPNRLFYQDENKFDFGPLVIGKKGRDKQEKKMLSVNSSTFDIINEGHFKTDITFELASTMIEEPEYKKEIFCIHPNHMELAPGQIEKIRVWCIPDEARLYRDELICMIKDNPSPFVVKMEATGCSPLLNLSHKLIEFDRLLLNQTFTKILTLKNVGLIPLKWKIAGAETAPPEFNFSQILGELRPGKETQVEIKFASAKQQKFEYEVKLVATDAEDIGVTQEPQPVMLKAEAFNITVKFDGFGNSENILQFGDLEVGRRVAKTFTVKNEGLYDVKFNFVVGKKLFRDNFKIQPEKGEIKPGEVKEITVVFKSTEEVKINSANIKSDIILEILEGKSSESFSKWPININVNAVYSQFSLNPPRQVNFGPVKFNEEATRTLELRNDGLFEFSYCFFDFADEAKKHELKEEQARILAEMDVLILDEKGKKGAKKDDKPKKPAAAAGGKKGGVDPLALAVGPFTVTPAFGSILPNSSITVEVKFKAKGNSLYEQKLGLDVLNKNPLTLPEGIIYELEGESCIPTINNSNFEVIFEEQIVVPSLQTTGKSIAEVVNSNVFVADERCFYFGTIIPSKHPEGVKERFKIVNHGKVHSDLKFQVKRKAGGVAAEKDVLPFKLDRDSAKIAPHESVYVTVTFNPIIMAAYAAQFEAQVTNSDPTAVNLNSLSFDLKGEGAMPTLKLEKPKEFINDNLPILRFPKTRKGRRVTEAIVIKNDGVIAATVKFEPTADHQHFRFTGPTSYTLTPKSTYAFPIEFTPTEVGEANWEVVFNTMLNHFETTKVAIKGECFFEGLTFEGLPQDKDDQLIFGDVGLDIPKKITFFIKNHTESDLRVSVDLGTLECLQIKPSIAHLKAQGTKTLQATIRSNKKVSLENAKVFLKTEKMKQKDPKWVDWDNARKKRRMIGKTEDEWMKKCAEIEETYRKTEAELLSKGKKVPKRPDNYLPPKPVIPPEERKDIEIEDPVPEPAFDLTPAGEKKVELLVCAKVDATKVTCDTKSIVFAPTLMYSSRTFDFKVKNESIVSVPYKWEFFDRTGEKDSGFYKVTPNSGNLRPESEETFQVRFAPTEVEENQTRRLELVVSNLAEGLESPSMIVESSTERPVCHFELENSTYLNSRTGDIPDVDMARLKIIEFESLGVKVKNRKRFYVINPTATGYEFTWKKLDVDLGGQPNTTGFFACAFERGVILSGKKFEMAFEYKPETTGLHESLWLFEIPTLKLSQYFLLVGKVVEPKVFFDVGKLDFGPLLIGGKHKETIKLKNLDYLPYHFNFTKASIKGENDYGDSLAVEPLSGVVSGESEIPLTVTFKPKIEGQYNYNLICSVAQKPRPLNLNVKGIGYILHHSVHLNHSPATVPPNLFADIDFGTLFVNERKSRTITVKNSGDFNFDYIIKKGPFQYITVIPETATVKTGGKVDVEVVFNPLKDFKLKPNLHTLTLSIVSGPSYYFKLNGAARKPSVEVSFASFDFGPCFVLKNPIKKTVILKMKNLDDTAISIEPLFEKKNYLDVQLPPGEVLLPYDASKGESSILKIPIVFTPREVRKYDEIISFDINQLHKVDVRILGEGVPLKLELKRTEDSFVDFGIARVGSDHTSLVGISNLSRSEVMISFDVDKQLEMLKKQCITILPEGQFKIFPRESKEIEIRFQPNMRINSFRQELKYKIVDNDEIVPLLTLQGTCQGMDLKLMEDVF